MSLDQQLNTIQHKLHQLLKEHTRLQKENEKLKESLEQSRLSEEKAKSKVAELQQQVAILKVTSGEMTEKDRKDFEKRINQFLRDIDKTINLLSE